MYLYGTHSLVQCYKSTFLVHRANPFGEPSWISSFSFDSHFWKMKRTSNIEIACFVETYSIFFLFIFNFSERKEAEEAARKEKEDKEREYREKMAKLDEIERKKREREKEIEEREKDKDQGGLGYRDMDRDRDRFGPPDRGDRGEKVEQHWLFSLMILLDV